MLKKLESVIHKSIHDVAAHFAQLYLKPIEGSTEKVNQIEFQSKNINGDIFFNKYCGISLVCQMDEKL